MKKLILLSILLIVGCDYAPTEHSHDTTHEHEKLDIYGCTNSYAFNYNPNANEDNRSCFFEVHYEVTPICLIEGTENSWYVPLIEWFTPTGVVEFNSKWISQNPTLNFTTPTHESLNDCEIIKSQKYLFPEDATVGYGLYKNSAFEETPPNSPILITYISDIAVDTIQIQTARYTAISDHLLLSNLP